MKKICFIAPVHHNKDVRIFHKQIMSLLNQNFRVSQISRCEDTVYVNPYFKQIKVPKYNTRLKRFSLIFWLYFNSMNEKADLYHIHNPDTIPLGILLKLSGKRVIYDTHEDFSKRILLREWIPKRYRKLLSKIVSYLEKIASYFFDHTFVTQDQILGRLSKKSSILFNYPVVEGENLNKVQKLSANIANKEFTFIYAGGISEARGIETLIDCIEDLNRTNSCKLLLLGKSHEKGFIDRLMTKDGWKFTEYKGEVPQEQAFAEMLKADVGLIVIKDIGDHATTSPNKIFEYQLFKLPFIASFFPSWKKIFKNESTGFFVNPNNKDEILNCMKYTVDNLETVKDMGIRGSKFIRLNYTWENEFRKMLKIYKEIL